MIPYIKGRVTRQAHVAVPEGLIEEEYAREGFFGKYAHLYRTHAPVGWTHIEGPLKPRAYNLAALEQTPNSTWHEASQLLMSNADVAIHWVTLQKSMDEFFRNADGDELIFVHRGSGQIHTDFGPLAYEPGDYIVIPRGTVFQVEVAEPATLLRIESPTEFRFPEKGMLGQHALFDPAVLTVPEPCEAQLQKWESEARAGKSFELVIKRENALTRVTYPFSPIHTVGWKGTLCPLRINVRDIRPVSSDRYHLPPSAHTTFVAGRFVVCSFLPRPLENGDELAEKVPFYHSNIDYDEVIFYHDGEFFSRTGVGPGMMTFHPQGIHHGPQEGARAKARHKERTNEVAVMIDTRHPLHVHTAADSVEEREYWKSWQSKG